MTPENITQLIGAIVTIAGLYFTYRKASDADSNGKKNAKAIGELHIIVNDRLTQLLKATNAASLAEGKLAGRDAKAAEVAAAAEALAAAGTTPIDPAAAAAAVKLIEHAAEAARQVIATAERLKASSARMPDTIISLDPSQMPIPVTVVHESPGPDDVLARTLRAAGTGPPDHPADPENRAS